MSERIITGLRANGELHLGNYLGALAPMVQLQQKLKDNQELFLFVPDLHSFTTPIDHSDLYENILRNVRLYQAAGINTEHERTVIFRQSFVPAHSELTWILNCFTYFGDKSAKLGNKEVSLGLLDYPVLMSADILLYGAKYVPLGEDQKQHLELTRTLAQRINNKFGDVLTVPETWDKQQEFSSREVSVRIRSLTNPDKKMSKSIDDPKGTIGLLDDPKLAVKKIMSATTDSDENIKFDLKSQPGVSNLLQIGAILSEVNIYEYVKKWHGQKQYGPLKTEVAGLVEVFLIDFKKKYDQTDLDSVEHLLKLNEAKARSIAEDRLRAVQAAIGIRR